jgi:hypothetical protein
MAGAGLIASTVAFGLAGTANAASGLGKGFLGIVPAADGSEAWRKCRADPYYGSQVQSVQRSSLVRGFYECRSNK